VAIDPETEPIGSGLVESLAQQAATSRACSSIFPSSAEVAEVEEGDASSIGQDRCSVGPGDRLHAAEGDRNGGAIMNIELVRALAELDGAMATASRNKPDAATRVTSQIQCRSPLRS
jgi:hypothetical protein